MQRECAPAPIAEVKCDGTLHGARCVEFRKMAMSQQRHTSPLVMLPTGSIVRPSTASTTYRSSYQRSFSKKFASRSCHLCFRPMTNMGSRVSLSLLSLQEEAVDWCPPLLSRRRSFVETACSWRLLGCKLFAPVLCKGSHVWCAEDATNRIKSSTALKQPPSLPGPIRCLHGSMSMKQQDTS